MDVFFGIICVILFLVLVLGPALSRWFAPFAQRWMMGKMEDRVRRMAGMPTRKEERKARKAASRKKTPPRYASRRSARPSTIGMLRYVAEDVEFTEIKEFGSDGEIGGRTHTTVKYRIEEQIEDVEFVEIKQ